MACLSLQAAMSRHAMARHQGENGFLWSMPLAALEVGERGNVPVLWVVLVSEWLIYWRQMSMVSFHVLLPFSYAYASKHLSIERISRSRGELPNPQTFNPLAIFAMIYRPGLPEFFLFAFFSLIIVWPFWRIFRKAGLPPAFGLLMVIPFLNLLMVFILAFSRWPLEQRLHHLEVEIHHLNRERKEHGQHHD